MKLVLSHIAAPLVACVVAGVPALAQPTDTLGADLQSRLTESITPVLADYCYPCHSEAKSKGDVRLDNLTTLEEALRRPDQLILLRELVATSQMPPEGKRSPSDHQRLILTQWLDAVRHYVPPDASPDPGWFTIHRLNRSEYRHTLRDLLFLPDSAPDFSQTLPPDDTGYGFDNIADVLSTSPLAVEAYLTAAEQAVEAGLGPIVTFGDVPRPLRLTSSTQSGRVTERGGVGLFSNGAALGTLVAPVTGDYVIRVRAWETHAGDEFARLSLRLNKKEVAVFDVSGTRAAPELLEHRVRLDAGEHDLAAAFTNDYWKPDVADRNLTIDSITLAGPLDASGTIGSPAWETYFAPGSDDDRTHAGEVLGRFGARAYRRPLAADELDALLRLYEHARAEGTDFEPAVRQAMTAVLVSPNFLFRTIANPRPDDPSHVYRLDGYELASRLSYFLWSSMPDGPLLAAASDGTILSDEGLLAQTRRMLADPRSEVFVVQFAGQWLQLRKLDEASVDTARFPEFDPPLRDAMTREATLFFARAVRENRPATDLLDAPDTFLNARLAAFYGVPGVSGDEMRPVTLPQGSRRGGVMTMGAVLTLTSSPVRTSPVKRGLFVLDQLLGMAPPPPPADIPPLEQAKGLPEDASLRERLAAHVADSTCASCHTRMDPLGLALENFDAIGRWRDTDAGRQVDASGELPGHGSFEGPEGLKRVLRARSEQFIENLASKLLTYAVGRGPEPFDRPAIRRISAQTRAHNDGVRSMIEAVVLSDTFRTCRGREPRIGN